MPEYMRIHTPARSHFYRIAAVIFFGLTLSCVYALPGVKQYLPDSSGEYIYFRDYTFKRKSYIGFLCYDDHTFAARYYAPTDKKALLPEQTVSILFTIDPDTDYVKFTGERFLTAITADDNEIVNYLHGLMFDLDLQRKTAGDISPETESLFAASKFFTDCGISKLQNYPQFGGDVNILFDYLSPLFNIKKITTPDGRLLLEAVTAGCLTSSTDNSFSDFKGMFDSLTASTHTFVSSKETKPVTYMYSDTIADNITLRQQVKLDSVWTRSMDNLWLLGNSALLSINSIVQKELISTNYLDLLFRKIILGTDHSYSDWTKMEITKTPKRLTVVSTYFQYDTQNITHDIKIVSKMDKNHYGYFLLTVFDNVYTENKKYFDAIVKSYTVTITEK